MAALTLEKLELCLARTTKVVLCYTIRANKTVSV